MDAVEHEALDAYSQIVTSVADKITPRVASVSVRQRRRGGTAEGAGSAVVLTGDGHLLTNAHVVTRVETGSAAFSGFSARSGFLSALAKTGASFLPYLTITSRRWLALRRSSRHCANASAPCDTTPAIAAKIALNRRPNEN